MEIQLIKIPVIEDYRGNIGVVEKDTVPFEIKRVYYLFDVPSSASRGGHAHKEQAALLVPLSGSFDVVLHDGKQRATVTLNKPDKGLLIPRNTWRELENFSSGAVCMVISSGEFDEGDYIRDFDDFLGLTQ
ncbi:sugar 3,4-ketoisomerase [Flavobacterium selenitireducens]|uniref:sugar 3,4-ketoisomerase n=1 Tax=Flavobacterium selenitireducens TaxID=2722704 RepID=UPI00168C0B25|nr:FdtA/QdtA family cupin domain-containing protein [Flavobacterium selenitireducens]MBD3582676.1 WxcM-like domain-containing protein [Flavobacterium selenitireducens]